MSILSQSEDTMTAVGNALSYAAGNCTRWVAENFSWVGRAWGNAGEWLASAQKAGFQTTTTPTPGAVAVWGTGSLSSFGHVAIVKSVSASGIVVSEENYLGQGIVDTRSIGPHDVQPTGYILPPGGSAAQGQPDATLTGFSVPGLGDLGGGVQAVAQAIAGIPQAAANATLGAVQNTTSAAFSDVKVWGMRNAVALFVALAVALVLFGEGAPQQQ